ncbi:MAG: hypothetical protein JOZ89_00110, partial [Gammaproteobacteria bacterium]|nr:hypothetical protein [Gammaproteobacteria bacterium]
MWQSVLGELHCTEGVKLLTRGHADVWLADGHGFPPDARPLVIQLHEASWLDARLGGLLDATFAEDLAAGAQASISAAERVITPSRASKAQVVEFYKRAPEDVYAVPHGVDHSIFNPQASRGRNIVGAPYVLFVGLVHPRKNFAAVRAAVGALANDGLDHVLVMVGKPPPDARAEEFVREATAELPGHPGRVRYFEQVAAGKLAQLMAGA